MRKKKDQVTTDPRFIEYNRAIGEGISKGQLIQPQYVRTWRISKRLGSDIHVFNYNCHIGSTKMQVARFNVKTGILTIEYKHHFPMSKKDHYPDLSTMQAVGKKEIQKLLSKRRDEIIYVIDGAEGRKKNGMYYVEHQLVTKLPHQPSEWTLNRLEEIFKCYCYHDEYGVNRWEEEIYEHRKETAKLCNRKRAYGEMMEPPTLTIE